MNLLLKRDNPGHILEGSDQRLLERATQGDDLTLFIQAPGYDEFMIFGSYMVSPDRVSALSLQHLAHGDLPDQAALDQAEICTSQYIYDSRTNNVLVKDFSDEGKTLTQVFSNNPFYKNYAWYSTRRYASIASKDIERLKSCGDQFKIMLNPADNFKVIVKPDIIYFPYQHKDYLVKSAAMVLPTEFVRDPSHYIQNGGPLFDHQDFSLAYLNIASDNLLTIVHKQRFVADETRDDHIREGTLLHSDEGGVGVTRVYCEHSLLFPSNHTS
jgi:hypothetical protein